MKRILLAYDGTEHARRALDMAADLAKRYEAPLSVVSVIPIHAGRAPIDPWDDPDSHAAQLREANQLLGTFGRFLQGSVSEHVATHARATVVIAR